MILLNTYLTHSQVKMIELSVNCLKKILNTDSGIVTFEEIIKIDSGMQSYLAPYKPSHLLIRNNNVSFFFFFFLV